MKKILFAALAMTCLVTTSAHAGSGHDHGPKHGGIVRETGAISYELVARADTLTLHVSDHGKPISTQGAKAEVTLHAGNDKIVVVLEPAGDSRMGAKGAFKTGVGVRAALRVTLAGKPEATATFNLK